MAGMQVGTSGAKRCAIATAVTAAAFLAALPALAAGPKTRLISQTSGGAPAEGYNVAPSISTSGRYVAFQSDAANLPGDLYTNIFVRDRKTGKTRLVSKTSAGDAATGNSADPSVSGSGRYVAFESFATNLPGAGMYSQLYVHDRKTGKTRLVSKTSTGEVIDGGSTVPVLSRSGRYVAFESYGSNLPGSTFGDVYVHDRKTGKTRLVSKTSAGDPLDSAGLTPSISASGRYVGFASLATNLPAGGGSQQIYLHDRKTGKTRLVSKTSGGEPADGGTPAPSPCPPPAATWRSARWPPISPGTTPSQTSTSTTARPARPA